jgi:hypothetical protein
MEMSDASNTHQQEIDYRLSKVERQVKGVQREQTYQRAVYEKDMKAMQRRIRDLELRDARNRGVPVDVMSKQTGLSRSNIYKITGVKRAA